MLQQTHGSSLIHPKLFPSARMRLYAWTAATTFNLLTGLGYAFSFTLAQWARPTDGVIAALDLDGEGSLNAWLNTVALFALAVLCLAALALRAVKSASRRELACWGWAAGVFALMSMDEGGSLHEAFKELCVRLFATRLYGDGSLYWAVPYAVLLAVAFAGMCRYLIVTRLWPRLAIGAGAACFLIAALGQLELFWPTEDVAEIVLEELLEAQGTLFLIAAVAAFVREQVHVTAARGHTVSTSAGGSRLVVVQVGPAVATTAAAACATAAAAPKEAVSGRSRAA